MACVATFFFLKPPFKTVHGLCGPLSQPRDYSADIEAAVTAKMSTWKPQHLALWVDMVEPPKAPLSIPSAAELVEIEDQSQAARFREIRAKLSQDVADMTTFNSKNAEIERRGHVVSVMHEKAQMAVGKQLLDFSVICVSSCLSTLLIGLHLESLHPEST